MKKMTLHQLNADQAGTVLEINGGCGLEEKLNNLGIRPGKEIVKINESFIGGPVTVQIDHTKVAVGHGMAEKIIVEVA